MDLEIPAADTIFFFSLCPQHSFTQQLLLMRKKLGGDDDDDDDDGDNDEDDEEDDDDDDDDWIISVSPNWAADMSSLGAK